MSISNITQELQDVIEKNLPAQVGETLRKRLEQADLDAKKLENTTRLLVARDAAVTALTKENESLKEQLGKHTELGKREDAVKEAERDQKVFRLETELNAERRISNTFDETLGKLVRNVEYRSRTLGNENLVIPGNPGGNGYQPTPGFPSTMPVDRTKTSSAE